ncbi:hypothetical protein [Phaeacidiphilus oryzae]|uniref:hypothetical protein n=1 Tax=Phaeacidiphilus oryzae TaxID=348818 RepID=UPI00068D5649|nr:hypothetical protein [Phaeacidiphilus oryzae]
MSGVAGPERAEAVLIGIGSEFRRDDGVAMAVLAAITDDGEPGDPAFDRVVLCDGEPTRVIEAWQDAGLAVVVDAVHAHPGEPGRIHQLAFTPQPGAENGWAPEQEGAASTGAASTGAASTGAAATGGANAAGTHGLGLGDAAALGAALGLMPERLVVIGVEGQDFDLGPGLSPPVAAAVPAAAGRIRRLLLDHHRAGRAGGSAS